MIVAAILGVVVGYGLALWRERSRPRECERECSILRAYRRDLLHRDMQLSALFRSSERMAMELALQAACADTRAKGTEKRPGM